MKIQKHVVQWFKKTFSILKNGGFWFYPNGDSIWNKADDLTISFASGDKTDSNNILTAAHIRAAGFNLIGI
jgi:hypothetical protein